VTHEIGRYDGVLEGQQRYDLLPGARAARDPVKKQDGRPAALAAKAEIMPVDLDVLELWARMRCVDPMI